MEAVGGLLSAFGLATSAGPIAYVPILVVVLVARFTDWIQPGATWEPLTRRDPPPTSSVIGLDLPERLDCRVVPSPSPAASR